MITSICSHANEIYNKAYQTHPFFTVISDQIRKIQDITQPIFSSLSASIQQLNDLLNTSNHKVIAMISCMALLAMLALAILRKREPSQEPPPLQ